ncbi:GH36-type glycosyl hydrolase domain-containing protein [Paenibacillus sp. IHBB 10380]|uniref:GH36-type glycosyl hydrolase domain-containing protein n=1 Tax=Paenibacillus sp. IHBB 10380 TaxID=1566358 RepID=UPI0005CFD874|nr:cellobiose phosphorylase [Paenibacillus sp. IHBB 10380]AJS61132.1 cellobiose phosphorylase [Paenibacillus sp. IHBB 10380]
MIKNNEQLLTLEAGSLTFRFLPSGDLFQATYGGTMINQWLSNSIDGSLNNIYLRVHDAEGIQAYPLLGVKSQSRVRKLDHGLVYEGVVAGVRYQVMFTPTEQGIWFWDVKVEGHHKQVDLIYGQDLGIADPGTVRSNEAYLSQYIDHAVFKDDRHGYVVCSRQNQPQGGVFPYIQQGSLTKAASYSTDGFQFYGLSYKETNEPACLTQDTLANEVYQYEFAYTALQSERIQLDGEARFVFYGLCKDDHPTAITTLEFGEEVLQARKVVETLSFEGGELLERVSLLPSIGTPLHTEVMSETEINRLFPNRQQEEVAGNDLLAFFTDRYEHVVLKEKELRVERPHGHILMSGDNVSLENPVMTTTSYMYGIFNSQVVVGNTNFNKMTTNARNALNVPKTAGQRIYVEIEGVYRLLTMPSLFEMGFNYVRWYYKTQDDLLIITNFTAVGTPEVRLNVRSERGISYRFLVSNQITMNVNEYEIPYHMRDHGEYLSFHADSAALSADIYPELEYRLHVTGTSMTVSDERKLVSHIEPGEASLTVLELDASSEWTMTLQGLLNGGELPLVERKAEEEIERYREFFRSVMNGFHLSAGNGDDAELFKVNGLAWWYTHNMLVHYSVPHGLEQYGGAAWGTRDVCQGPVEYFMATHKYDQVRATVLNIYSHQYEDDGNWPQWFMFDKYTKVQQEESHGDIIVWPLKVLGDYLNVTRDYSILEQQVPYTRKHSFDFTTETATVLEHAYKEIDYIKNHFLHGTHLSSYGDGDWDDTLQPANAQLKQYMVSSWTVALTYQTLNQFSRVMEVVDPTSAASLRSLADGIQSDFNHYMLQTEVIPGFLYMENPEQVKLLVHPSDAETGIQYRLLPMTRSMISELLTPEQAATHYEIIREQLFCPDGVRLMNRPAQYVGGVSTHFKRAEQASNFGREVGLQYVHAHIRYVEAMAKLGKEEEVWSGLARINPIGIQDVVPNAELRQSNAYFSSSDGKFNTRYDAQDRFDELRSGQVPVKGGWKIYSSGPGIYMNQLISNALGIRQEAGSLIIDPVLPQTLDGLRFDFEYAGAPVQFVYHLTSGENRVSVNGQDVATETTTNRYRTGGLRIDRQEFDRVRSEGTNIVEIYIG